MTHTSNKTKLSTKLSITAKIIKYLHKFHCLFVCHCTKPVWKRKAWNLGYKTGISFTKWDSWVTNGTLGLQFTLSILANMCTTQIASWVSAPSMQHLVQSTGLPPTTNNVITKE